MPADRQRYHLECAACGERYEDDGLRLACDRDRCASLLRTVYHPGGPALPSVSEGLFRYAGSLPVRRILPDVSGTVCYHATALGRRIGLEQLWVSFNGSWPRHGADLPTGTFKDLEAATVLARLPEETPMLVIASAGNTAAAFAAACSRYGRRCLIVVPSRALDRLAVVRADPALVTLVAVGGAGTYEDAIVLARAVCTLDGFEPEGGYRNVGRRDGLGTCLLAGFEAMGRMPAVYVQAVGSGAGALGAYEAARRLRTSGQSDDPLPRLVLCQNAPYAPMFAAWRGAAPFRPGVTPDAVLAPELINLNPPMSLAGGISEALHTCGGDVVAIGNTEVLRAVDLFRQVEHLDIEPAAGVALAGLAAQVAAGRVGREEPVLLNVTGGGRSRLPIVGTPQVRLTVEPSEVRDPGRIGDTARRVAGLVAYA